MQIVINLVYMINIGRVGICKTAYSSLESDLMVGKSKGDCHNTNASIKKNYVYNLLYQLLTLIVPLITAPYTSRVFKVDGIGIQSYTNSIVAYFTLFAALGTASYGQREIAMNRDDGKKISKLFWEIETVSIIATIIAILAWFVMIIFSRTYTVYYLVLTVNIIAVAFDISWFFSGLEMFKYIVLRNSVIKIAGIVLLFTMVRKKEDLLLYMALTAVIEALGNISMWSYLPKFLEKIDFKSLNIFYHFKYTITYFIPTIASSVYTVMDKSMIGVITNETENGYYEQATKIIRMAQSLLLSLNTVMTSRMSHLFAQNKKDEIREKILQSYDFLLFMAILFMFGMMAAATGFVQWFLGMEFGKTATLLCFMSPLPLIICISNVLGSQYLTPSGQRVRSSKGIISGACVNFVCNLLLIPKFGAIGAATASLLAESVIDIIYVHMSKGYITWKELWDKSWKRFLSGAIMMVIVYLIGIMMGAGMFTTVVQIICGVTVYGLLLTVLGDSLLKELGSYILNRLVLKMRR